MVSRDHHGRTRQATRGGGDRARRAAEGAGAARAAAAVRQLLQPRLPARVGPHRDAGERAQAWLRGSGSSRPATRSRTPTPHACVSCARRSGRSRSPTSPASPDAGAAERSRRSGRSPTRGGRRRRGPHHARCRRSGADGAVATLLGILHEAQLSGDWVRMKGCRQCGYAFYDRSRNRSAAWCAMAICGNRTKNRAYYRRRRTARNEPRARCAARRAGARGVRVASLRASPSSSRCSSARAAPRCTTRSWRRPTSMVALGLNIVVGFAGLLDLGYVAFFAIGAHVTAISRRPTGRTPGRSGVAVLVGEPTAGCRASTSTSCSSWCSRWS